MLALYELAQHAKVLFQVLTAKSWIQDNLSAGEQSVIRELTGMADKRNARRDKTSALLIVAMPFLSSVTVTDAAAVNSLASLRNVRGTNYLQDVLSHPILRNGIRDEQAAFVAVLSTVVRQTPNLLDSYLAPGQAFVWQRTLSFPNFGDVDLIVASQSHEAIGNLDWLEHAVRSHIAFMGVPFPTNYVTLWVHNEGLGGGGGSGRLDSGYYHSPSTVAHESAHVFWPFGPIWIAEGGAVLLEQISEHARCRFAGGTNS